MSRVLLPKLKKKSRKLYLCSFKPKQNLIGKTVYVKRCHAKAHFTEDGKCVCSLVGKSVKIVNEQIYSNGYISFEAIVNNRSFFLERGEFLPLKQLALLKTKDVSLVSE